MAPVASPSTKSLKPHFAPVSTSSRERRKGRHFSTPCATAIRKACSTSTANSKRWSAAASSTSIPPCSTPPMPATCASSSPTSPSPNKTKHLVALASRRQVPQVQAPHLRFNLGLFHLSVHHTLLVIPVTDPPVLPAVLFPRKSWLWRCP